MPITKATGYKASDGVVYATVEDAQVSEMKAVLKPMAERVFSDDSASIQLDHMAKELLANRDLLIAILTTGPRSRPGRRKAAGTTAPRRAAKRATQAQAAEGFQAMRDAANGVTTPLATS